MKSSLICLTGDLQSLCQRYLRQMPAGSGLQPYTRVQFCLFGGLGAARSGGAFRIM
jgi:hypothetical protein